MSAPAISVIIPTRDRAELLPGVLDALAAQACAATFEVLVVDNASTDATSALLAARCAGDPRFRAMHEPVLGRSAAMNAAAADARGDLLLFTDDDVIVAPDWIETYRRFFSSRRQPELILAGGPIYPIAEDLGPWPRWLGPGAVGELIPLDWGEVERELRPPEYLWGANMALKRSAFQRIGLWDETIGRRGLERGTYEDVEYQDRLRRAGGRVWYCPRAQVLHRLPAERVTPATILSNAFARGRNAVWTGEPGASFRTAGAGWTSLLACFAWWATDTLAFRISGTAGWLERARLAAASSGTTMERALGWHDDTAGKRAVASVAWFASRGIVRLARAPGSARRRSVRRGRSRSSSRRPGRGRPR